jgi:predicted transcriptional regulator
MGLKGDLATMGLEDIFQWLAVGKKTGVLELKGLLHTKRTFFHDGKISSVWSSDPREYLGQYLLAYNRITEEQLREALACQEDENQLLGRILINRQLITEAEIQRIVQLKVEESIYDCFLWEVGSFEFHDGMTPPQKSMLLSLDVTGIVMEGARRVDEWTRIRKVVKGGDAVVAAIPEAIAEMLPLAPEVADILSRLDGAKSIDQLVIEMRVPEFKINKLIFDLYEKGMIRILSPGGRLGEKSSLQLQRARQLVEKQKLQEASRMLEVVEHMLEDTTIDETLIPELAVSIEELMQAQLGPNEAFLATRVNGVWSIKGHHFHLSFCPG